MSYQFSSRVRYSEIGPDTELTLPALLNYYQDCTTFQSASIGHDIYELASRHRAWVLNSWQVEIVRYPSVGEEIITTTIPYDLHGFLGLRNFVMETAQGERLSWANSIWSNLSTLTGLPERLGEEDLSGYVLDEKLDMDYKPRKIALPDEWEAYPSFAIQRHHLDTHRHVNNCQYVRMAEDYLPEGCKVRGLRVEYKKQALLGDVFYPLIHKEDGETMVIFNTCDIKPGEKPVPYAVVEARYEM